MGMNSIDAEDDQFAYRYDTQLLIERRDEDLDEDDIHTLQQKFREKRLPMNGARKYPMKNTEN